MAMNISAANFGITLGAVVGGWVVERWGVIAIGWCTLAILPLVVGLAGAVASHAAERAGN
jgi:predicted MFS family arabinose efflux permease